MLSMHQALEMPARGERDTGDCTRELSEFSAGVVTSAHARAEKPDQRLGIVPPA
eukprot:CAMPEP_0117574476 /NCGR_PEP_ID=MMETSP0784-20121206/61606_1 /TAXON_ID=39447 /ORGANISM="" /LENGTH=53 /DNA_ID=CAMNT_0005373307 /DNA_START=703 /DNA_END=864 /DNA_ORIENTATION=-